MRRRIATPFRPRRRWDSPTRRARSTSGRLRADQLSTPMSRASTTAALGRRDLTRARPPAFAGTELIFRRATRSICQRLASCSRRFQAKLERSAMVAASLRSTAPRDPDRFGLPCLSIRWLRIPRKFDRSWPGGRRGCRCLRSGLVRGGEREGLRRLRLRLRLQPRQPPRRGGSGSGGAPRVRRRSQRTGPDGRRAMRPNAAGDVNAVCRILYARSSMVCSPTRVARIRGSRSARRPGRLRCERGSSERADARRCAAAAIVSHPARGAPRGDSEDSSIQAWSTQSAGFT